MPKLLLTLIALAVVAPTGPVARAQTTIDPARVDSIVRKAVAEKHIVGLNVGVMQNGSIVFEKGYGLRNIEAEARVTSQTMFAIGSVTKQFTCTAVLMLAEQHKLSLADHVSKWYPNLTRADDITLLDLGGHLSGYHDYYPLDFVDREMSKPATADQIIDEYATQKLDFEPRSRWSYSNTGFLILGRVVEKVSGERFGEFLEQHLFAPLSLGRTAYEPEHAGDMASGYTSFALSDPIPAEPEARGWAGMAGAIWSTPHDLLTWDRALVDHSLISKSSYDVLATPQRLTDGRSSGYGCGESVNDRGNALVLSHGGAVSGFVALNTVIPASRSAVVLLSNTDFSPIGPLNQQLVQLLMPRSPDVPAVAGPSAVDAAKKFLLDLEKGTVDRSTLGDDFNVYLTPARIEAGRHGLNRAGAVSDVAVPRVSERGGMAVAAVTFRLGKTAMQGLMYRTPDGKIQEFLVSRE